MHSAGNLWTQTARPSSPRQPPPFRALAFDPAGRALAAGGDDGWVVLWDLPAGQPLDRFRAHPGAVRSLAFSPDGCALATAAGDWIKGAGELALWGLGPERDKRALWVAQRPVCALAFSPDGAMLLAAAGDGSARALCPSTLAELALPSPHDDEVLSATFSPAGDSFALASADRTVSLWRSGLAAPPARLAGHTSTVWGVAFSPDGKKLATAGADGLVGVWGARTGDLERTIRAHRHPVRALLFCPQTGLLVTAEGPPQGEASIKAWDIKSGEEHLFARHPTAVLALALSPDGRTLASAGRDGAVRLWSWGPGRMRPTAWDLPICARRSLP